MADSPKPDPIVDALVRADLETRVGAANMARWDDESVEYSMEGRRSWGRAMLARIREAEAKVEAGELETSEHDLEELSITWLEDPEPVYPIDIAANLSVPVSRWKELGATFVETDDNDGEKPLLAAGFFSGLPAFGLLSYEEEEEGTYLLTQSDADDRSTLLTETLNLLLKTGAINRDEIYSTENDFVDKSKDKDVDDTKVLFSIVRQDIEENKVLRKEKPEISQPLTDEHSQANLSPGEIRLLTEYGSPEEDNWTREDHAVWSKAHEKMQALLEGFG